MIGWSQARMAFFIIFSSLLLMRIEGEELKSFDFLKIPSRNQALNTTTTTTEIYLEHFFSWHEPTIHREPTVIYERFTTFSPATGNGISMNSSGLTILPSTRRAYLTNDLSSTHSSLDRIDNRTDNNAQLISDSNESNVNIIYDVPVYLIVLLALAYGLVSLTAVIGNSIVLWFVVRSRKLRTVTNIFIANLAIADILIGALAIPFQFQAALLQRWVLPHIMCSFCSFVQIVSVNVSVCTLSAIAADRYLVVFYPIKYRINKRFAKFIIVFIWIFSVMAAVPALIALRVVYIPDLMNVTIDQELSSALLNSLALMNVNSANEPQNTLNETSSSDLDTLLKQRSTSINSSFEDERPTRPTNTLFWLDDVLAKIDLMQNKDEKLGSLLHNITLPTKPHCGNVGLSVDEWKMYNLFLVLIQYFIPLIVITFAYTKMGLKLRETDQRLGKSRSSKFLQRINTASSTGFSSSSVRTANNLTVSPGAANCNIELQQTGCQASKQIIGKRCRSLDCSPLEEAVCKNDRKYSQVNTPTGRHSPKCPNCQQQKMNTTGTSTRSKHRKSSNECFREHNDCLANGGNLSAKRESCKCRRVHENAEHDHTHHYSLHRHQSAQSPQQSPIHQLQPTGSVHSNLMMPMISHPISALRVNSHAEYIVINKKKVIKMLFIVCSLFAFLWLPLQTYNLLKDFFIEINGFRYINIVWFVMHFMAMLSASTNPFVYAIYSIIVHLMPGRFIKFNQFCFQATKSAQL